MLKHGNVAPTAPERVVIIGAGGFVGSSLASALGSKGISVLPVTRGLMDLSEISSVDNLIKLLKPTDTVVVLAAITPDKARGLPPFLLNLSIIANLCKVFECVSPAHVVYLSSDAVYPMGAGLINEETCAQPPDLYGMMHLAREMMLASTLTAPFAILRPTLIYGAGDTHNSYGPNRMRRMAHKEGHITLFGEGEETRDHIFIGDVVTLIQRVLDHRSTGTLNIATGRSISFASLARLVAGQFRKPVTIKFLPRQAMVTHRHFDISALVLAFPDFVFTPLEDGLAAASRDLMN